MKVYIKSAVDLHNDDIKRSQFAKFYDTIDEYMPDKGQGDTLASQAVTAVNKLIYKFYNDGDVFDNSSYLRGWANDLSSYANWLYTFIKPSKDILDRVYVVKTENEYAWLLYDLADLVLTDSYLSQLSEKPAQGSIYDCDGPFEFIEYDDDEDYDDEYYEDDEDSLT